MPTLDEIFRLAGLVQKVLNQNPTEELISWSPHFECGEWCAKIKWKGIV